MSSLSPHPKQVRYAWQSNPEATRFNGAGLPAAPFRTDDWPIITQNAGHTESRAEDERTVQRELQRAKAYK